jgi:murein DD-endopeptidase MepM/ murein hydrolase activator NlpD
VPLPPEDAQARLNALGIDRGRVVRTATSAAPPAAWAQAVPGGAEDDLLWPVRGGRFWRGFGARRAAPRARVRRTRRGRGARARGRGRHEGVDIGAEPGTPILAAASGLVVYSDNYLRGYGNALVIVHRDGSVALYSHCRATLVAAGEFVARGQVIAEIGDTGLAHGPHLHFEWRVGGAPRDPLPQFVGRPDATDAEAAPTAPSEGAATAGVDRDGRAADRSEAVGHASAVPPAPDRPSTTPLHVEDARAVNPG